MKNLFPVEFSTNSLYTRYHPRSSSRSFWFWEIGSTHTSRRPANSSFLKHLSVSLSQSVSSLCLEQPSISVWPGFAVHLAIRNLPFGQVGLGVSHLRLRLSPPLWNVSDVCLFSSQGSVEDFSCLRKSASTNEAVRRPKLLVFFKKSWKKYQIENQTPNRHKKTRLPNGNRADDA